MPIKGMSPEVTKRKRKMRFDVLKMFIFDSPRESVAHSRRFIMVSMIKSIGLNVKGTDIDKFQKLDTKGFFFLPPSSLLERS